MGGAGDKQGVTIAERGAELVQTRSARPDAQEEPRGGP
jgi:hypothetical protein